MSDDDLKARAEARIDELCDERDRLQSQLQNIVAMIAQIAESPEPRKELFEELYKAAMQKGANSDEQDLRPN